MHVHYKSDLHSFAFYIWSKQCYNYTKVTLLKREIALKCQYGYTWIFKSWITSLKFQPTVPVSLDLVQIIRWLCVSLILTVTRLLVQSTYILLINNWELTISRVVRCSSIVDMRCSSCCPRLSGLRYLHPAVVWVASWLWSSSCCCRWNRGGLLAGHSCPCTISSCSITLENGQRTR